MTESPQILRAQLADIQYLLDHIVDLTPQKLGEMRDQLKAKIEQVERRNSE